MNYLAHTLLSFGNKEILIGNFIADHIRLPLTNQLPAEIKRGVMIHRKIDAFTDSHPHFLKAKRFFTGEFERYSGVLMDIYYDYILASNFDKFADKNLKVYTQEVYHLLDNNRTHMPDSSKRFLDYVLDNDTFYEYSKIEGIEKVLTHLSYRINHGILLSKSLPMFQQNLIAIDKDFPEFMSDLSEDTKKNLLQY